MTWGAIAALTVTLAVSGALSEEQTAKRLPGNAPCVFPLLAEKEGVAGPVRFVARVTPEGATESVEIRSVPLPELGFEEAVRGCVMTWRFEPAAAGEAGLRRHEGNVRYRVAPAEEAAVRQLLEGVSAAWNTGESARLEELETRPGDVPGLSVQGGPFLHELIQASGAALNCRLELDGDVSYLRFRLRDLVEVRQSFACGPAGEAAVAPSASQAGTLDLIAVKGPRGWRFARISELEKTLLRAVRVGGEVHEPKRLKYVRAKFTDAAREARVQGRVMLECLISPEGHVIHAKVLRGIPLLDQAAIEAVRQWEYAPTLVAGHPVPVIIAITVDFHI